MKTCQVTCASDRLLQLLKFSIPPESQLSEASGHGIAKVRHTMNDWDVRDGREQETCDGLLQILQPSQLPEASEHGSGEVMERR